MQWSELLPAIATALAAQLEGYTTAVGAWARLPGVDTVHVQLARMDIVNNRERTLRLHVDLFVQPPADITDSIATAKKLEVAQAITETVLVNTLPALGAITVSLKSWENDGGVFYPTWGSRLTLDVTLWYAVIAKPTNMGCYNMSAPTNINIGVWGETDAL